MLAQCIKLEIESILAKVYMYATTIDWPIHFISIQVSGNYHTMLTIQNLNSTDS